MKYKHIKSSHKCNWKPERAHGVSNGIQQAQQTMHSGMGNYLKWCKS